MLRVEVGGGSTEPHDVHIRLRDFSSTRPLMSYLSTTLHCVSISMFHEGDLQSGIALAVQTQKAVFCFIHGLLVVPLPLAVC